MESNTKVDFATVKQCSKDESSNLFIWFKLSFQTCSHDTSSRQGRHKNSYDSSSRFKLVHMIQALVRVDTKIALQFYYLIKFTW